MSQELTKIFDGYEVRFIVGESGDIRFVAKELAAILKHSNTSSMVSHLCRNPIAVYTLSTAGGPQEVLTVSEADAYRIVCASRLPTARSFEKLVFEEVLPTIRKNGMPQAQTPMTVDEMAIAALSGLMDRVKLLTAKVEEDAPKVEFYDEYADAKGNHCLQLAGKILRQPPNKWIAGLERDGYLFRRGGYLVPKAQYEESGLFIVKPNVVNGVSRPQTLVTPKGIQYFAKRLQSPPLMLEGPEVCQ